MRHVGAVLGELDPRNRYDILKDSVHGYIRFTHVPLVSSEKTEKDLIDSPWVQRLRRIRQLQTAWFVYPSADHSRFIHSLGVMETAGRFARAVYEPYFVSRKDPSLPSVASVVETFRIAGLLHDVGHGPFSHLLDDCYFKARHGVTHEDIGAWIIKNQLGSTIRSIRRTPDGEELGSSEAIDPEIVANIVRQGGEEHLRGVWKALYPIIRGAYDADKMDFLLRDGASCGMQGIYWSEIERLISTSFLGTAEDGAPVLLLDHRSKLALLTFLRQRHTLTWAVYYHRTVKAIEHMIRSAVAWAVDSMLQGYSPRERPDRYLACDEGTVHALLLQASKSEDDETARKHGEAWVRALSRQIPWKEIWASEKYADYLSLMDKPEPNRVKDLLLDNMPDPARAKQALDDKVWVDTPLIEPPRETLNVVLWNAGSRKPEMIGPDTLHSHGVPRYWINYRIYIDPEAATHKDDLVAACRKIAEDHHEQDTSW